MELNGTDVCVWIAQLRDSKYLIWLFNPWHKQPLCLCFRIAVCSENPRRSHLCHSLQFTVHSHTLLLRAHEYARILSHFYHFTCRFSVIVNVRYFVFTTVISDLPVPIFNYFMLFHNMCSVTKVSLSTLLTAICLFDGTSFEVFVLNYNFTIFTHFEADIYKNTFNNSTMLEGRRP